MSDYLTMSRPYAKAIFEIASEQNARQKWAQMLEFAAKVMQDKQVLCLINHPKFSFDEVSQFFLRLGKDVFNEDFASLVCVLVKAKRLKCLPFIYQRFKRLQNKAENRVDVYIVSAWPLTSESIELFSKAIGEKMSCKVEINWEVDPSLLGGAIIRANNLVIDGSLRKRLEKIRDSINL